MGIGDKMLSAGINVALNLIKAVRPEQTQEQKEQERLQTIYWRYLLQIKALQKKPEGLSLEDQIAYQETMVKPMIDSFIQEVSQEDMETILVRLPLWREEGVKDREAAKEGPPIKDCFGPWIAMDFEKFYREQYLSRKNAVVEK